MGQEYIYRYVSYDILSGEEIKLDNQYLSEESIISDVKKPIITVVSSEQISGSCILIIPGGGYRRIVYGREGISVAKYLVSAGYTTFILSYRLPESINGGYYVLNDANSALKFIKEWSVRNAIQLKSLGVIGFSAGGHVASWLVSNNYSYNDCIRPDYLALLYPVVSMNKDIAHTGCRRRLIIDESNENIYSVELNIPGEMPPVFIVHSTDDNDVSVEHSLRLTNALLKIKSSVDVHFFEKGGHGFGMSDKTGLPVKSWTVLFLNWLASHSFHC